MQEIQREALAKTLGKLKTGGFDYLKKITAVDYVSHIEAVYILYGTSSGKTEIVKVKLDPKDPSIESVIGIYKAADWYEREMAEMFGIKITGRKSKRLLLEKWNGSEPPLRKGFIWGNPNYKRL
ncbi:MAG: NADH-quinone oxidoreductase subunit C [Candidatus Micrarchaeota archaeon]|nr:NADH-quinone oxidoreductase subunit C [Candidatus Micrarchaeota archaeon]